MTPKGTIIIVDDNKGVLAAVRMLLTGHFAHIITLQSPNTLPTFLRQNEPDILLLDMNFTTGINNGNEGLYWLHEAKRLCPALPIVLFTAYADIELAVRGIKEGAADFVVKPWENAKLIETLTTVANTYKANALSRNTQNNTSSVNSTASEMFWGKSNTMQNIRSLIAKVAVTDANILITGENGTGKEVLAREIHRLSSRKKAPLVTVDMGAISESLFESELFGHTKGAFTNACSDRKGKFEAANKGTLFLDEIGNLPRHLQAKLLTTLQDRSVIRVGSNTPIPISIRLICATNRNLPNMVASGEFREDLLYRINTIHIEIPSLRERREDIVPLAERFISRFAKQYDKKITSLSASAAKCLTEYSWYGNIRELEHAIEKAIIISDENILTAEVFSLPQQTRVLKNEQQASTLEEMERQMIQQTLEKYNGNLSSVAAQLGIARQTLYNKMKKYGL